jgi:hypothetical protein
MGKRLYLFNKPALIEAAHGYGFNRVIKALEGAGALGRRDNGRNTKNYRLPGGGQARLHVVDLEVMDMEGAAHERHSHATYPDCPNSQEPRITGNSGNTGNGLVGRGL